MRLQRVVRKARNRSPQMGEDKQSLDNRKDHPEGPWEEADEQEVRALEHS